MATSALPPMPVQSHRKLVWKLLLIVALSFAFGFALVPLYDVFCKLTGLNGKTVGLGGITTGMRTASPIDLQRIVTVEFTGTVMPGLAWEVEPVLTRLDLHPGELHQGQFLICKACHAAIELELPAISQAIVAGAAAVGFAVESQTVEVVGLCAGCQGAA